MGNFKNIGIAGLGMIGGSLALEIKRRKIAGSVTGFSRRLSTLKTAEERGMVDEYFQDFSKGAGNLDLLVIATPLRVIPDYLALVRDNNPSLLVTDVGSVKESVVETAHNILGKHSNFVGSHPMAGSEKQGIGAARENLFQGRYVIITPCRYAAQKNVRRVKRFWELLGARTLVSSPAEHDSMIALTSHFPHLAVYSLIAMFNGVSPRGMIDSCVGPGFLDTTRIGKSNSELWGEIFLANRVNLLECMEKFSETLGEFKKDLETGNYEGLVKKLEVLKKAREQLDETGRNI